MKSPDKYQAQYHPKKDRSYTIIVLMILAFFIGLGLIVSYYDITLISIFSLSKFIVAFAVIGFLIPLKVYQKWFHFIKYEVIIFNIIGISPLLTGLFLLLNYSIASEPVTNKYRVEKIYIDGQPGYETVGVVLEKNFFSGEQKIVQIKDPNPKEMMTNRYLKVTIAQGLFGFEVVQEKEFVK